MLGRAAGGTATNRDCGEHRGGTVRLNGQHRPHGFTGILFAYTSCFANNGQSFAGLSANTPFYNLTTALAMMVGRFGLGDSCIGVCRSLWSSEEHAFFVGNSSDPFFCIRGATHDLLDCNGGPELPSCLGTRSRTGTNALGKVKRFTSPRCGLESPRTVN